MIGFIYKTTCLVNDKIYIGKHEGSEDDGYIGSGKMFQRALRKYGKENFKREILRRCETLHELRIWEHVYIKKYHSQNHEIGYNIADGDVNSSEYNPAKLPEVREKMSKKKKGKISSFRGKTLSDEAKRKISEATRGKNNPMYGISLSGELNGMYGKHHSEETKRKISESKKNRKKKK